MDRDDVSFLFADVVFYGVSDVNESIGRLSRKRCGYACLILKNPMRFPSFHSENLGNFLKFKNDWLYLQVKVTGHGVWLLPVL